MANSDALELSSTMSGFSPPDIAVPLETLSSSPSISVDAHCNIHKSLGRLLFRQKHFTSLMTSVLALAFTMTFVSFMFRLSTKRSQPNVVTVLSTLASPRQLLKLDAIAGLLAGEILQKINFLLNHEMSL